MIKRITCNFVDTDCGEVIYNSKKEINLDVPEDKDAYLDRVFASFKRGMRIRKSLCFMIVAEDYEQPKQLNIF